MKKRSKLLSIITVITMVVAMIPVSAFLPGADMEAYADTDAVKLIFENSTGVHFNGASLAFI